MQKQQVVITIGSYSSTLSISSIAMMLDTDATFKHRDTVMAKLEEAATSIVNLLESPALNPKPKDEPCCDKFKEQFNKDAKFCAACGTEVSEELRKTML
jgi:hypothetical protein